MLTFCLILFNAPDLDIMAFSKLKQVSSVNIIPFKLHKTKRTLPEQFSINGNASKQH